MTVVKLPRKRKPLTIPAEASRILSVLSSNVDPYAALGILAPVTFRLKRVKSGVRVILNLKTSYGSFQWDVTRAEDVHLLTFTEARKWVSAYAERHGQQFTETFTKKTPRATGEDRRLLRAGKCRETWLASDIPELWAEAMCRCQHPAMYCGEDGYCHYGTCDMEMSAD